MENDVLNPDIPESEKNKLLKNIFKLKDSKINLMVTGVTGCGKSSTINALTCKNYINQLFVRY